MRFRLVSQQLTFEEGEVSFRRALEATGEVPRLLTPVPLRFNQTEDVPGVAPGEILLLFNNCVVRSHASNRVHRIAVFRLPAFITEEDIVAGIAHVIVGFHGFARVEAVDRNDEPLAGEHLTGVALPGMSIEVKGPEGRPLQLLLPPGEYVAYLAGPRAVSVQFAVHDQQEDAGTIRLRYRTEDPDV